MGTQRIASGSQPFTAEDFENQIAASVAGTITLTPGVTITAWYNTDTFGVVVWATDHGTGMQFEHRHNPDEFAIPNVVDAHQGLDAPWTALGTIQGA